MIHSVSVTDCCTPSN